MENYKQLQKGETAFFMPWKDIIISDVIIEIHEVTFYDKKSDKKKKATMYEFEHIQGKYRAYRTKEELEKVLGLI